MTGRDVAIEFRADGTFYEDSANATTETMSDTNGIRNLVGRGRRRTDCPRHDQRRCGEVEDSYAIESLTDTERRIRMEDNIFVSHRVQNSNFPIVQPERDQLCPSEAYVGSCSRHLRDFNRTSSSGRPAPSLVGYW